LPWTSLGVGQIDRLAHDVGNLNASQAAPAGGFVAFAHGEPAEYLRSGFGVLPPWLSVVLFDCNPLWHLLLLLAALFNEYFLEAIFGRHLMAVFNHSLGPLAFIGAGTAFVFGKATLLRKASVECCGAPEVLRIGSWRTAQRLLLQMPSTGAKVWLINVHTHSGRTPARVAIREAQIKKILAWMAPVTDRAEGILFIGDFNASPQEPAYRHLRKKGFRSAFLAKHGEEPVCTFPGEGHGLLSKTKDNDPPGTFDYIFMLGDIDLAPGAEVALFANAPSETDETLYPSDHYGIYADITVGAVRDKLAAASEVSAAMR